MNSLILYFCLNAFCGALMFAQIDGREYFLSKLCFSLIGVLNVIFATYGLVQIADAMK